MRKHKLLIVLIALGLTWGGIATAQDKPLEEQLVDALTKVFGAYPGFAPIMPRAPSSKAVSKPLPKQPASAELYCSTAMPSR